MRQSDVAIDRRFLLGFRLDQKAGPVVLAAGEHVGLKKGTKPFTASASESMGLKKGTKPTVPR